MATPKIIDSMGKQVGSFITFLNESKALVQFKINHKNYVQPVTPDQIGSDVDLWLYHTQLNCGGQSYVQWEENPESNGFFPPYYMKSPFGWINRHPEGVTPQTILPLSYTSTLGCTNLAIPEEILVITFEQALVPDFRAGFTPPFVYEI